MKKEEAQVKFINYASQILLSKGLSVVDPKQLEYEKCMGLNRTLSKSHDNEYYG